ncbi:MAG TPA: YkgJ family cysteine cluster protein [Tepidisphaeraceae bacterium]|nr:YkgJ family cysteine cluster protein [Tepidisphaeraceae bacterium]
MRRNLPVIEEKPWFADGLSFNCTVCGNCCTGGPGYVWMSDDEIDRLAEHLKISRDETLKKYCRKVNGHISLKESRDENGQYPCVFLTDLGNGKRGCGIYPVRPLQCRTWPFWDGNLASKSSWKSVGRTCPGLNTGRTFSLEQIVSLRDAKDWPERAETPSSTK